ncbi:MAG: hypothetical protein PHH77_08330 [Victivallaceae bacterium]|nr:hypothetical protein [Victivallaceae bacterium]
MEINDVFEHCKETGTKVIAQRYYDEVDSENFTPYFSDIGLYLDGKRGQRLTIYFRDIEISGNVPSSDDVKKLSAVRWAPARKKMERRLEILRNQAEAVKKQLTETKLISAYANNLKTIELKKINAYLRKISHILERGFIRRVPEERLATEIREFNRLTFFLKSVENYVQKTKNVSYLPFVVNPISDQPILPASIFFNGECGTEIKMTATPGEFEPASFLIKAIKPLDKIIAVPTELKNVEGNGIIPVAAVDVKLVKCWYQGGTAWLTNKLDLNKVMVPELLLNDDSLVKVDTGKKENYLKLSFPEGEKYVWISDPGEKSDEPYKLLKNRDFPVKDSPGLLPVNIPGGKNQQFWITVKVPAEVAPGLYRGKINLVQAGRNIGTFSLDLNVLPFKLLPPYYTSSVYYRAKLSAKYVAGTVSSEYKTEKQLEAELKNMVEHGVSNPTCYQPFKNRKLLEKYFSLRKSAGMNPKDFYYCYGIDVECGKSLQSRKALENRVKTLLAFLRSHDIDEVYFYGRDEAKGERLKAQRMCWDILHKTGGKAFVAGVIKENFEKMGDIQDLLICSGKPLKGEAARWHSQGHKIWSYANPQAGVENPAVYRRNFGILLWQNDYDGACTFAYQCSYGNIWNDFDGRYRDESFTYPTVDGVIDTIAWEGYREAVDDVRYLTTLLHKLEKAKKDNNPEKQKIIAEAEKYLKNLKETDIMKIDLDNMRRQLGEYIMALRN